MRLGDISVSYVELMVKATLKEGHNPEAILAQYGLDSVRLSSPMARISIPRFMRLGHALIKAYDMPCLGLLMGQLSGAPSMGLAGLLAQSAHDIRQACIAITTYELLNSFNARGSSSFYLESKHGVMQFYSISPYNNYNFFVVDSVLSSWRYFLERISSKNHLIQRVEIEFEAPAYKDQYAKYFDCDVQFNCERNAIILKPDSLDCAVEAGSASTFAALQIYAQRELEKVRLGLTFQEQVARAIGPLLSGQTPTLEQVAQRLNSTPWIVRRKLQAESVSFQQVLNETRKGLAISYVCDTTLSLGEIAYVLGFGSSVAFQRAFKRWTGEAPGQFRESNKK